MTPAPMAAAGGFRRAGELLGALAEVLRPPRQMSIAEAAEKHRRFKVLGGGSQAWSNGKAPYMVEIMDAAQSRAVSEIYITGPAQFGKSELFLNVATHAVLYRPADILIVQPTKVAAEDFGARRLDRMLEASKDVGDQLGDSRSDRKALSKTFKSGMKVDLVWPTVENLSGRPIPIILVDERDRMTDDVGGSVASPGEGDPVRLAKARTTTFGKEGKVIAACSPSREDGTGIAALVQAGDFRILAVHCLQCGEPWTPGFDADRKPTLADLSGLDADDQETARSSARLVCPDCGYPHDTRERDRLLAAAVWLPRGVTIDRDGRLHGQAPATRVRSYWLAGQLNPFKALGDAVAELVGARLEFERTGNEQPVKTVMNTVFGHPYRLQSNGAPPVEADDLAGRRNPRLLLGQVPRGARFLTAQVDVQGNRFEVMVLAWDEFGQSWIVDRFAIVATADGVELRPAEYPEHWLELLPRVIHREYPLEDNPDLSLPIATTTVDTGGVDGVSEHAKAFWKAARKAGVPDRALTMVKGSNMPSAPPLAKPTFEVVNGKPNPYGYRFYMVGVSGVKDLVANRLRRTEPGPGHINIPGDLADRYLEEATAEAKVDGRWKKRRRANETFDLLVYGIAAFTRLRPSRLDWTRPPEWGVPMAPSARAALGARPAPDLAELADEPAEAAPVRRPPRPPSQPAAPPAAAPSRPPAPVVRRPRQAGGFVNGWK